MDADFCPSRIERTPLLALRRTSDRAGLVRLAGHGATLAVTGLATQLALGSWLLLPAMAVHGAVLVFLFAPLHESIHRTAFRSRALNDGVAWVCGLLLLLPPDWFRAFHFAHHRHTQVAERDPELATPKPATVAAWIAHLSGLPYWTTQSRLLLRHAAGRVDAPFVTPRAVPGVVREARIVVAVYGAVAAVSFATGSWAAVTLWLAPAMLGQPWLRAYLLAEHTLCPSTPDMLVNSRTTLTNKVVKYLAWNMPYHAEHHAFPAIPFHALPQAHLRLRNELGTLAPGYLAVQRAILRNLPLRRPATTSP